VYNLGVPGVATAYLVSRMEDNLERYRPDMVVSMIGINDIRELPIEYGTGFGTRLRLFIGESKLLNLGRWISEAFKNRPEGNLHKGVLKTVSRANRSLSDSYYYSGVELWEENRFDESRAAFYKALELDPGNEKAVLELAKILKKVARFGNYTNPDILFREGLSALKGYDEAYPGSVQVKGLLAEFYLNLHLVEEAKATSLELLKIAPEIGQEYFVARERLTQIYREENGSARVEEMRNRLANTLLFQNSLLPPIGLEVVLRAPGSPMDILYGRGSFSVASMAERDSGELTSNHYRLLADILQERGVRYVAMQYPTLDVEELKNWLGNRSDVAFVSNRENFEAALKNKTYGELFVDSFGVSFGHATVEGNRLIAESAAEAILNATGAAR
jgi:tetratricopeptide (TPR) repeat protein